MLDSSSCQVDALFISPHFDDVALSCGGTVALEARRGRALVVTVFAGQPTAPLNPFAEFQHHRWGGLGDAVSARRREDVAAMAVLGASYRWMDFADAIYRGDLYLSDADLFGDVKPQDEAIEQSITDALRLLVASATPRRIYLPLAVGHHVDHELCFGLAAKIEGDERSVLFYEDFPYAAGPGAVQRRLDQVIPPMTPVAVDVSDTIEQRLSAIRCYASQLPTIFRDYGAAEEVILRYARDLGGSAYGERFWQSQKSRPLSSTPSRGRSDGA